MSASGKWDDLLTRLTSGGIVASIGLLAVWFGGPIFLLLTTAISAVMVWELVRMLDKNAPAVMIAGSAAVALLIALFVPVGYAVPLLIAPVFVGFGQLERRRATFSLFSVMILLAGYGLFVLRDQYGFLWMMWLVLVVIATDIAGYFAGRFIGGPKFWPRVSPKKTWAGTIAGWVGAALVGAAFVIWGDAQAQVIGLSVALSMASQIGDIAESAVKRRVGVKDSSNLIPGHGGLFDRFDGMLGASILLLMLGRLVAFPPGLS
ncbi:phosphatidate cytidylyltransferase [Profundibacterium mesophilum]|uniref:Phosphatidate cytidylyltransferase n=1 Tax=Profundibacterium mesophilum KAUST100406-0324 TaxID=1037889 RepID=A0A921TBA5_9RHOB|nr:phosphatidate cytidylyltransferase [Profundibacterium mesophilum]KAF0675210.1 Phosphatidate cytidylyltransferase [Profundibacterium mesophilum KAUST100406-0324]